MIINRRTGTIELVEQVEHGRVAGELAGAWGNQVFERPTPLPAVSLAADSHDEGWRAIDGALLFDELAKRPLHFLDIDVERHIPLYRAGVERVSMLDAYAGLLVGMHWSGIYRGRWQKPRATTRLARTPGDGDALAAVVRAEEERWIGVREQVWTEQEPRAVFETRLWHHFELLQLWDLLSLFCCVVPDEPAPPSPVAPWGPQMSGTEHVAEAVRLPTVGVAPGGPRVDLVARVVASGPAGPVVELDPFPYASPVSLEVEVRTLPDQAWTRAEALAHLARGTPSVRRVRLVAPVTPGRVSTDRQQDVGWPRFLTGECSPRQVVRQVAALAPRAVVYVACDPAALARDTAYLQEQGYRLEAVRAFDLFPKTHHVECVALLTSSR